MAESFDYEIIDKAYQPYDNLSLLVCLKSTGDIEKKVIASVTESLKADYSFGADWARLVEIFQNPSLQMISFTLSLIHIFPVGTRLQLGHPHAQLAGFQHIRVDELIDGCLLYTSAEVLPEKEATWLVYCRTGRRSAEAVQKLDALGYSNLYDLGGILSWPYEIEGDLDVYKRQKLRRSSSAISAEMRV